MTKKYVFLQVRSNSKRLPNKCLYPILENPNILLLYKRIVSKHYKIILLTSKDKTDDYLVNLLKKNDISFLRGNSENVYNRFIEWIIGIAFCVQAANFFFFLANKMVLILAIQTHGQNVCE